jgi:methyl-accepting chemotaxis protein
MHAQPDRLNRPLPFLKQHVVSLLAFAVTALLQVIIAHPAGLGASAGLLGFALGAALFWLFAPYAIWLQTLRLPTFSSSQARFTWHLGLPARLTWRLTAAHLLGALLVPAFAAFDGAIPATVAIETALLGGALCILVACVSMMRLEELFREATIDALAEALEELGEERWTNGPTLTALLPMLVFSSAGAALVMVGLAMAGQVDITTVLLLSVLLLSLASWTVKLIVDRHNASTVKLQDAVARLGTGLTPTLWVTGDETGRALLSLQRAHEKSASHTFTLRHAGLLLMRSVTAMTEATNRQSEMMSTQSAALNETNATATEIKQTSLVAAQKASEVLALAEKAEEVRRQGEEAVERSVGGLTNIGEKVQSMAEHVKQLDGQLRQVTTITTLVKDLADQSNMLALNAAIEAARAGEQGRGFTVVAREIRSLADQSIQATKHIQQILTEIADSARTAVSITESGLDQVSTSLAEVQSSRENIRRLSSIAHDNATAVRQIAAAVNQQNAGVGQIFEAVRSLSDMMTETLRHLESSQEAISLVESVSSEVMEVVRNRVGEPEESVDDDEPRAAA